jgi:carbonic anhydrase
MQKSSLSLALIVAAIAFPILHAGAKDPAAHSSETSVAPAEALLRLKAGNQRFISGKLHHPHQNSERRKELAAGQAPFAIVLGCSDSRIPPEVVFDQGLGDLFVVRVAGNVINDEGLGSIEYAVEHLGARLIIVLGHERCGAVKAAKETIAAGEQAPAHIASLVTAIKPAVEATVNSDLETTVKANVKDVVQALRSSAPVLKPKIDSNELSVVGAYYSLDTGSVAFLDEK